MRYFRRWKRVTPGPCGLGRSSGCQATGLPRKSESHKTPSTPSFLFLNLLDVSRDSSRTHSLVSSQSLCVISYSKSVNTNQSELIFLANDGRSRTSLMCHVATLKCPIKQLPFRSFQSAPRFRYYHPCVVT